MDRISPSEGDDAGSIPAGSTEVIRSKPIPAGSTEVIRSKSIPAGSTEN